MRIAAWIAAGVVAVLLAAVFLAPVFTGIPQMAHPNRR